jgi:hypothetical protein
MRQLCPYCGKLVDLPDTAAGSETPCPSCNRAFAVPKSYTPSVAAPPADDKPTAPPGLVTAASSQLPSTAACECSMTVPPRLLAWVPAFALTVALISVLFFSWVGSFPGGQRVFAQSPLQALVATYSRQSVAAVKADEEAIDKIIRSNWLMLPFLLALAAATTYAWLEQFFPEPGIQNVPGFLAWTIALWPRRHLIMVALTAVCLALILVQSWRGFALETAIHELAETRFAAEKAAATSTFAEQEVRIKIGQEVGRFCLDDTFASTVGFLALAAAFVTAGFNGWHDRRGRNVEPRIVLYC